MDTEALLVLARDASPHVRAAVAGNPSTPAEALRLLAADQAREPNEAVAVLGAAVVAVGELVLSNGAVRTREYFAGLAAGITVENQAWFEEALSSLKGVPGAWKLEMAIERERTERGALPIGTQRQLIDDPAWQVRACLARATADPSILDRLSHDPHPRPRLACIENSLVTVAQIDVLLHDKQRDVRAWVAGAATLTREQMLDVAANEASEDVLDMLIHRTDVIRPVLEIVIEREKSDNLSSYARRVLAGRG